MAELKNYTPPKKDNWQGRIDEQKDVDSYRWHQLIGFIDLNEQQPELISGDEKGICFLGFCCDEGIKRNKGRTGAAQGPYSIRKMMSSLPFNFDKKIKLYDAGDVYCPDNDLEKAQQELSAAVKDILCLDLFPIVLGGGHEVAFGHFIGIVGFLATGNRDTKIGIINFDAHFDIRPYHDGATSGTSFLQISDHCRKEKIDFSYLCLGIQKYGNTKSLFKTAQRMDTKYILAEDINSADLTSILKSLDDFIEKADFIYLTICTDVFPAGFAPGVSAPQPLGLDPEISLLLIKDIIKSRKLVSLDIAEVSPRFDLDNRTAKLAAVLIFNVIDNISQSS